MIWVGFQTSQEQKVVKKNYRPLPSFITIKKSKIEGLGLFATQAIDKNKVIGICHIIDERFYDGVIRTPLGGFVNHSNNPNCIKVLTKFNHNDAKLTAYMLKTKKNIKNNEELTLSYTLTEGFTN